MSERTILVSTEQRPWAGADGTLLGRQRLDGLAGLPDRSPTTVIARAAAAEAGGSAILPGSSGHLISGSLLRPATLREIWEQVGRAREVVVYCPGTFSSVVGALALLRRRKLAAVVVGNGLEVRDALAAQAGARRLAFTAIHAMGRLLVRRAEIVRYVTSAHLQDVYPAKSSATTYGFTDARLAMTGDPQFHEGPGPPRILLVGTLDQPYKGIADMIEAVRILRADHRSEVTVTVVGDGRLRPELDALATSTLGAGVVTFVGGRYGEDLLAEFRRHTLLLQASHTEGLSRVLLEAIGCGLPVVATDVGGTREVIAPAGLYAPRDPSGMAERLGWALDSAPNRRALWEQSLALITASLAGADQLHHDFIQALAGTPQRVPVAHIFGVMDRGGAELRTIELMEALPDGPVMHFLTLSGRDGVLDARIAAAGGQVHKVPLGITFPFRFVATLRRLRIEVLDSHVHTFSGAILSLGRLAGVRRRIAHFRSDGDDHGNSVRRRMQRHLMRRLIDATATDLVGVSPSALTHGYAASWPADARATVIPNGIRLRPPCGTADGVRSTFEIPAGEVLLMHVGRPAAEKNRSRLPAILAAVNRDTPAHLVLVGGEGSDAQELTEAVTAAGMGTRIHHAGSVDNVLDLLAQADVLVQPSLREGLPGSALEASAVGTPVVFSDVPGAVWIGEQIPSVNTLSLAASNEEWAAAIHAAAATRDDRDERIAHFAASQFAFAMSVQGHAELWS